MKLMIRQIQEKDNKQIEKVIRTCLLEFGGNREGLAWSDSTLGQLSKVYNQKGYQYWVAVDDTGKIMGGVGIGKLEGTQGVCELQKMYCLPEARGTGISHQLITLALDFASQQYEKCYLETLSNMVAANKFYQKYGFKKLEKPYIQTEHFACDVWYIKDLK